MIEAHPTTPRRIVVAHDWLCGVRGGEHVLERVCGLVQRDHKPTGLLTLFADGHTIGKTVDGWVTDGLLNVSWLNGLPGGSGKLRRWLLPLYPAAAHALSQQLARIHAREPIDLLISTSSAAVKGILPPPGVPHLCYCFSPARYVWGGQSMAGNDASFKGKLRRAGLQLMGGRFRAWDRRTATHVTKFVAISEHIRRRIRDAYGVESEVIFPPVRTEYFTPERSIPREDFWLCVGALEPYKRADLAIESAMQTGARLKIAGTGSQHASLVRRYGSRHGIEFLDRVSDEALRNLYRRAKVLIFPQEEDFGIVAVEAQACGLPVAALARGGALDMVVDGRTGVLFEEASIEAITRAVERLPLNATAACRENSLRFSEARFDREFAACISAVLSAQALPSPPGATLR